MDTSAIPTLGTAAFWTGTFLFGLVSGLVPFVLNVEVYLLAVAAMSDAPAAVTVGLVTAGQSLAKWVLYLVGRGALNLSWVRRGTESKAAAAFAKRPGRGLGVVAVSSLIGVPPLYGVSLVAGALHLPMIAFIVIIVAGRVLRFGAVYLAPGLFR